MESKEDPMDAAGEVGEYSADNAWSHQWKRWDSSHQDNSLSGSSSQGADIEVLGKCTGGGIR